MSPIFQGVSNFFWGEGGLQPEYGQRSAGMHPTGMHCFPSFCKTTVEIKENFRFASRLLRSAVTLSCDFVTEKEHITFNLKCIILKFPPEICCVILITCQNIDEVRISELSISAGCAIVEKTCHSKNWVNHNWFSARFNSSSSLINSVLVTIRVRR